MHSAVFFTKFEQYKAAFQSLFSEIIRICELFFRSFESYSSRILNLQWKTALPLSRNYTFNYPYILSLYILGKTGFFLTHGNKIISDRSLVPMLHIFEQSENKIITWNLIPCNRKWLSIWKEPLFFLSFLPKSRINYSFLWKTNYH